MDPLATAFDERLQEIEAYLNLLEALERQVTQGPPVIGEAPITAQQQRILYSSVYLQLYNLVEATATWCIDGVAAAAASGGRWQPSDLSADLRREWVRAVARTHTDMNYENRLRVAVEVSDWLLEGRPVAAWAVEKGGGGNWDDMELEAIASRLGCQLSVSKAAYKTIKQPIRDDKTPLVLVKFLRNKLAHGALSFTECGENVTVKELRAITDSAAGYLREVVDHFQRFIDNYSFLTPSKRPAAEGPPV